MKSPYLGRNPLRWCDRCHVPVLTRTCACGARTREVPVTPPGDIRPAFPSKIRSVNDLFEGHFGAPLIPEGHLALLNKVPDTDRMEEVIVGGAVVAAVRYLPAERRWEPLPRLAAAPLMKPVRRFVVVDAGAVPSIREGASVLAPGLVSIDGAVVAGDEVCILDREGTWAGVGRARVDAAGAREMRKGQVVKTRKNQPGLCVPGPATWEQAVEANRGVLDRAEATATAFIQEVRDGHPDLTPTVSYSGGKDSLATLLLVLKAIGRVPLIFADSGLEFPETYANVDAVRERYGLEVVRAHHGGRFQEEMAERGPPAVDARWCCRACKLTPVAEAIRARWGECLSFIGQRQYESATRAASARVWRNPNVQVQLAAAPLQHWTALHVWLYLFREGAPYNTLYEQGMDRIGCFMCPSSDLAVMERIRELHPALWAEWEGTLEAWRQQQGLPGDWVSRGLWRRKAARGGQA
ncbi:MAG: phosphoadenosine phosphosulfate reductase family protein [Methanomicrobiales archaeon]|nr:phosphoadenosine phosphosulfate reductase family protein [Methanomicrobiales archaeon]